VEVSLLEPNGLSRDHTERLLRYFGYVVRSDGSDGSDGPDGSDRSDGVWVRFSPTGTITPFEFRIPGDISSAAFLLGAAILAEGGEIMLRDVGVNPTRDGFLRVVAAWALCPRIHGGWGAGGQPVARPGFVQQTSASKIPGSLTRSMLAVLASRAEGTTRFHDVGELRVKESNRLVLIAENLTRLGVSAEVQGNDLLVTGTETPPRGRVVTQGDHRIAMALRVGKVKGAEWIDEPECAEVAFPGFAAMLGVGTMRR
jgi:3-phosphoshikimate 1-carboxyvinyltransferase